MYFSTFLQTGKQSELVCGENMSTFDCINNQFLFLGAECNLFSEAPGSQSVFPSRRIIDFS